MRERSVFKQLFELGAYFAMVGALFLSEPEVFFAGEVDTADLGVGGIGAGDVGWLCDGGGLRSPRGLLQAGKPAPLLDAGMRAAGAGPRGDFCRTEASATFGPR